MLCFAWPHVADCFRAGVDYTCSPLTGFPRKTAAINQPDRAGPDAGPARPLLPSPDGGGRDDHYPASHRHLAP